MATINAIAHLNELTKDVTDDYYLTAGKWLVTVTTQQATGGKELKEPRSFQYAQTITVGAEENPDENPDIL